MGYNTTVVVMNDALSSIERDPEFGKKLSRAISEAVHGKRVDVISGCLCNAATVIETHHADQTAIVTVGGNYGTLQAYSWGFTHHTPESAEKHLREWADKMGFVLHRKVKKPWPANSR